MWLSGLPKQAKIPYGPTSLMETGKELLFPMMLLPATIFLGMTTMQPYEDLKDSLVQFEENMGKTMFVSHQWVTAQHPDPEFMQVTVLQQALQNLISGGRKVSVSVEIELAYGRVKCPKTSAFARLYIWLDYFSCPQGFSVEAMAQRELAISCIPAYVAKCVSGAFNKLSSLYIGISPSMGIPNNQPKTTIVMFFLKMFALNSLKRLKFASVHGTGFETFHGPMRCANVMLAEWSDKPVGYRF